MTQPMEMFGAEGVSRAAIQILRARVPKHLDRQRLQRGIPLGDLPDIEHGSMFNVPQPFASIERFPCLMVAVDSTDGRATNRQEASTGTYDELVMNYVMRVMVYAMGTTYSLTELNIQRYVLAVRASLVAGRVLGDQYSGNWGEIDLNRLREGYEDPLAAVDGGQFLSGGYVEVHVTAHEQLYTDEAWGGDAPQMEHPSVGVSGTVNTTHPLVHPAMADEPLG